MAPTLSEAQTLVRELATFRVRVTTAATDEKARKAYQPGEWNRYRIVAQGDRIRTWVNGVSVADSRVVEKEDAAGFLGLQVHSIKPGTGPYQVRWRGIQLRELKADEKVD